MLARLVADDLAGMNRVERQRAVYQALADELAGPVHALGDVEKAGRLISASDALFEAMGINHQPADQPEIEAAVRSTIGSTFRR